MPPVQPPVMDDLPIPQITPASKPMEARPDAPEQMQPSGWMGGGGNTAYLADRVFRGFMAGKKVREDKAQAKAVGEVGNYSHLYEQQASAYKQLLDSGLDPNDPKVQETKRAVTTAYNAYLDAAAKYVSPEKGGPKKAKGAAGEPHPLVGMLHKMFGVEKPELFPEKLLEVQRQGGAPVLSYQPDKEAAMRREALQNDLEQQKHVKAQQADVEALQKQLKDAIGSGDTKAAKQAREQLSVYGVNVAEPDSDAVRAAREIEAKDVVSAHEALGKGAKPWELNSAQRAALRMPVVGDEWEGYVKHFGGDTYKAAKALQRDQMVMQSMGASSRSPYEEMRRSTAVILEHELQDPATAKKYGINPLRPGEKAPQWLVEKLTRDRYKETTEDKQGQKLLRTQSANSAIRAVLKRLPPEQATFLTSTILDEDEDGGLMSFAPSFPGTAETHWFGGDTYAGGVKSKDAQDIIQEFRRQVRAKLQQTFPAADEELLNDAMGPSSAYAIPGNAGGPPADLQGVPGQGEAPEKVVYDSKGQKIRAKVVNGKWVNSATNQPLQ